MNPLTEESEIIVSENDDLGADIANAIEDVEAVNEAVEAVEGEPETEEAPEDTGETPAEAPEDETDLETERVEEGQVEEPEDHDFIDPPSFLNADERAKWDTYGAKAQKYVNDIIRRRDSDVQRYLTQKTQELASVRKVYEELDKVFEPHVDKFRRDSVKPWEVVDNLLAWQDYMDQDPAAAIDELIERYQLTPDDLMQAHGRAAPMDPRYDEIAEQNKTLQQQMVAFQQQQAQQLMASVQNEIKAFAEDKDDSGNLRYPHFQDVYQQMVPVTEILRAQNPEAPHREILAQAYEQCTWANPEIRKTLIAKTNGAATTKAKTQTAKRAASSVTSSPDTSGSTPPVPETLDDAILMAMGEK